MENTAITMKLRVATRSDFYDNETGYKYGILYFIKSAITKKFDPFPYYLTEDTDKEDLRVAFKAQLLFVPVRLFDECIIEITESA